jgi:hypothetical protein
MGFEPTTSSMPSRRAPNCATAPPKDFSLPQGTRARGRPCNQPRALQLLLREPTLLPGTSKFAMINDPSSATPTRPGTRGAAPRLALLALTFLALAWPVRAQQQGPLPPPASGSPGLSSSTAPAASKSETHAESAISTEPPSLPVEEVIRKFSAHESEFRKERDNYTYTQMFLLQTIDSDGFPNGEYRMDSDIIFTPDGKRTEKITYAPPGSLKGLTLSKQDSDDLRDIQPFVLTTEELPKYNVTYVGRQVVDELHTYVFDVAPKKMEKDQRYFQGRVWVDDRDLQIVKSYGKAVPDILKKNNENIFPHFETYRENITGRYWFPTYTHADDTLHFSSGSVRLRMTVKYTNYKRFGSTIKIGTPVEVKE